MAKITKKDMLAWLDMQRDATNTEIVYAAPSEQAQYHNNLKVINAIAERVNEMTAVEFVEACEEICAGRKCYDCPLNNGFCSAHGIRRAGEIVKRWKEGQDE